MLFINAILLKFSGNLLKDNRFTGASDTNKHLYKVCYLIERTHRRYQVLSNDIFYCHSGKKFDFTLCFYRYSLKYFMFFGKFINLYRKKTLQRYIFFRYRKKNHQKNDDSIAPNQG